MGVDGATPSADAADIAICGEPGVTQMSQLLVARAMNTFSAGPDNDFVADTLKVMTVGRDGGRSGWVPCRCDQQAGPSAALVMASPQSGGGRGRSHAIG